MWMLFDTLLLCILHGVVLYIYLYKHSQAQILAATWRILENWKIKQNLFSLNNNQCFGELCDTVFHKDLAWLSMG